MLFQNGTNIVVVLLGFVVTNSLISRKTGIRLAFGALLLNPQLSLQPQAALWNTDDYVYVYMDMGACVWCI